MDKLVAIRVDGQGVLQKLSGLISTGKSRRVVWGFHTDGMTRREIHTRIAELENARRDDVKPSGELT